MSILCPSGFADVHNLPRIPGKYMQHARLPRSPGRCAACHLRPSRFTGAQSPPRSWTGVCDMQHVDSHNTMFTDVRGLPISLGRCEVAVKCIVSKHDVCATADCTKPFFWIHSWSELLCAVPHIWGMDWARPNRADYGPIFCTILGGKWPETPFCILGDFVRNMNCTIGHWDLAPARGHDRRELPHARIPRLRHWDLALKEVMRQCTHGKTCGQHVERATEWKG